MQTSKASTKPDPYVIVTVGNKSEHTLTRTRTTEPTWEQALTFLVCNPESDDVYLKVVQLF